MRNACDPSRKGVLSIARAVTRSGSYRRDRPRRAGPACTGGTTAAASPPLERPLHRATGGFDRGPRLAGADRLSDSDLPPSGRASGRHAGGRGRRPGGRARSGPHSWDGGGSDSPWLPGSAITVGIGEPLSPLRLAGVPLIATGPPARVAAGTPTAPRPSASVTARGPSRSRPPDPGLVDPAHAGLRGRPWLGVVLLGRSPCGDAAQCRGTLRSPMPTTTRTGGPALARAAPSARRSRSRVVAAIGACSKPASRAPPRTSRRTAWSPSSRRARRPARSAGAAPPAKPVPIKLPKGDTTWVATGPPGRPRRRALANGTSATSDPVHLGQSLTWRTVKAVDASGDAPKGPGFRDLGPRRRTLRDAGRRSPVGRWHPRGAHRPAGGQRLADPDRPPGRRRTAGLDRAGRGSSSSPATPVSPQATIVDTATGDLSDGPSRRTPARCLGRRQVGSRRWTLRATDHHPRHGRLAGRRRLIDRVDPASDGSTSAIAFALDADGQRLVVAWQAKDSSVTLACTTADQAGTAPRNHRSAPPKARSSPGAADRVRTEDRAAGRCRRRRRASTGASAPQGA